MGKYVLETKYKSHKGRKTKYLHYNNFHISWQYIIYYDVFVSPYQQKVHNVILIYMLLYDILQI